MPLETHYFEAYNHDNVRLVDVKNEDPIERITKTGILLKSGEHVELDVLIYATGFDAITGAFSAIDFRGEDGVKLTDVWSEGPRTFLGLFVHRFPNSMFSSAKFPCALDACRHCIDISSNQCNVPDTLTS